ncbi:MAG: saccharopine dehydrogenase NADP-binding domain-containing protein [Actinomycetota bacterium]
MAKVLVLGGCGAVGSCAVRTLVPREEFSEVIIGDINSERAAGLVAEMASEKLRFERVDVSDRASIQGAVSKVDLVLNCTGPFYKFVKTILDVVIEAGVNYVDVCDDVDVTLDILDGLDEAAKSAGVSALIGMGSSPGVTNLLAKLAATTLLDETDSVDIFHAHGGEPFEGEAVIAHRFHCMSIDVPMYLDGELKYVKFFEPDGIALQQEVDFHRLGAGIRVYPYPHPEQVTIPRYLKLKRVTNKGTVLPAPYYELTKELCRLGFADRNPLKVKDCEASPYEFAVAYILARREEILKETDFGPQRGCVRIDVAGKKDGKPRTYRFSLASQSQALGEGTGIPAAMGAILMQQGKITAKGVYPPEAGVDPADFIGLIGQVTSLKKGGASFEGVLVESIDADGNIERVEM